MFLFGRSDKEKGAIECRFEFTVSKGAQVEQYTCLIEDQDIIDNHIPNLKNSNHLYGCSNVEVEKVQFINCNLTRVPTGLKDLFPKFNALWISGSEIRYIEKIELDSYNHLKEFVCIDCKIELLPDDLFRYFFSLEYIEFTGNFLEWIDPNILDRLDHLKHVNFYDNYYHSICYSIYPQYNPNATLEELKEYLYDKLFERYEKLNVLKNSEEKLKEENQLLKNSKTALELKTIKFENSEKAFNNQVKQLKTSNGTLKKENSQLKQSNNILQSQLQNHKSTIDNLKTEIQKMKINEAKFEESMKKSQSGLNTDLTSFIQDETTKDFKIIIKGQEFPVHKFLLAARSPTLAEILKNNPEVENLNLVDISVEIFEIILKFLYTDVLPGDDGTNILQLFAAAGKLKIEKLVKNTASKIFELINAENALEILRFSVTFGLDDLKQKSFQEVKKKYENINFNDELIDNPEKLVKIITTFIKKEEAQKKFDEEIKQLMTI